MLFNKVKDGFNSKLGKKEVIPIPKSYHLNKARNILNVELMELVRESFHFLNTLKIIEKSSKKKVIELIEVNNFIMDVCKLQRAMAKFYDMSVHECIGNLKFVIKIDESKVIKGQKLERVRLTLRALDVSISKKNDIFLNVQLENEI